MCEQRRREVHLPAASAGQVVKLSLCSSCGPATAPPRTSPCSHTEPMACFNRPASCRGLLHVLPTIYLRQGRAGLNYCLSLLPHETFDTHLVLSFSHSCCAFERDVASRASRVAAGQLCCERALVASWLRDDWHACQGRTMDRRGQGCASCLPVLRCLPWPAGCRKGGTRAVLVLY